MNMEKIRRYKTHPSDKAQDMLKRYSHSDALIQAEQIRVLQECHSKSVYWELVKDYIVEDLKNKK